MLASIRSIWRLDLIMQELNKATRARVSNTMEGGKVGGKAFGGNLVSIISVGRNETFRLFFFIDSCLFLSLERFGKQDQRWTDVFYCFEIFHGGTYPRKNFWQEEQVEFSIKYFRLKHLQFSMQIFSSTRIKLFTQILGKRFNLVSVLAKIYAGDVLDRFNIRTRIPPPVNSRSKEGRRYLAASSVSLRRRGVGRSVCWRNRCRRKRIPDHILPRCVRFSVYVTWSLLSKEVERRTGCEIVSPNRAKKKPSLDNEAHSLSLRYYRIKELDYRREAWLTFICIRNEGKFSKNFSSKRNNLIILESDWRSRSKNKTTIFPAKFFKNSPSIREQKPIRKSENRKSSVILESSNRIME